MSEALLTRQEPRETKTGWEYILSLPIEARFAEVAGVKPICSFIWDREPEYIEVDGYSVAIHQLGPEDGIPVLSFHGNPGSGRGPHPTPALLEAENIRLIAFDAPGFGDSQPVLDDDTPFVTAGNVAHSVIKALGHEKVAVLARSGGVARALGFAALHPECISSMILIAGMAPPTADIQWQAGMIAQNQKIYKAAQEAPSAAAKHILEIAQGLMVDENRHVNSLWSTMSVYDQMVFELQPDLFISTAMGQASGVANGSIGWEQSAIALRYPWGFDPSSIRIPILIMHGNDDPYVGIDHGRWLEKNISNTTLLEMQGGHFTSWLQIRRQLAYLREQHILLKNGVKLGEATVSSTVHLDTAFKLCNSYDNYVRQP